jgi:hypothetical protein
MFCKILEKEFLMKHNKIFVLAMVLAIGFGFVACDTGGDDGGGGGGVASILKGTTWIKEGYTTFPKIRYVDDTPAKSDTLAEDVWAADGSQYLFIYSLTIKGNGIYNWDGSEHQYDFELQENNSKLILTNSNSDWPSLDGIWTKR